MCGALAAKTPETQDILCITCRQLQVRVFDTEGRRFLLAGRCYGTHSVEKTPEFQAFFADKDLAWPCRQCPRQERALAHYLRQKERV